MPRIRYTTTSAARISSGTVPSDCWNACAVPWKLELSVAGAPSSTIAFCTASVACPSATPWREVEADGDGRELALVADRERPHRHAGPGRERRQRHLFAGQRRLDVELVQRVEAALQLGQDFQDHVIAVELGEILRDLALAEGVVQRVVDQLRLDAVARGGVAVDLELQRGAVGLLVGRDVAQFRQRLHLGQDLRRPVVQLVEIGVLQRELELRARRPAAEPDVLRRLHVESRALDLLELRAQARDDLLGARRCVRCAASA